VWVSRLSVKTHLHDDHPGTAGDQDPDPELIRRATVALADAGCWLELAAVLRDAGRSALGAGGVVVSLLDPSGQELRLAAAAGYPQMVLDGYHSVPLTRRLPITDAVTGRKPVVVASEQLHRQGYDPSLPDRPRHVCVALPLQARDQVVGAYGLRFDGDAPPVAQRVAAGRHLSSVAAAAAIQVALREQLAGEVAQLRQALESRVRVEQAKGMVSHALDVDVDEAFQLLRHHARDRGRRISSVAAGVLDGSLPPERLRHRRAD
jgi:transcriptional regulator with GAF, ATPase, and Fis domain